VAHIRQSRPDSNVAHTRQSRPDSNVAHIRQSRPDSGLGVRVEVLKTVEVVPSSLGSGPASASVALADFSSSSLLLSRLELSHTTIYEPQIRALFGTDSHFCEEVVGRLFSS